MAGVKQVLFIQGGGDDGYLADSKMVNSLRKALGGQYSVNYPHLISEDGKPDFGWLQQIDGHIAAATDDLIIVAHSFGASMLLKLLAEQPAWDKIKAVFLLATPFWEGDEDWKKGFILPENFAKKLPAKTALFFFHCKDDEEVPFLHLQRYKQHVQGAKFYTIELVAISSRTTWRGLPMQSGS